MILKYLYTFKVILGNGLKCMLKTVSILYFNVQFTGLLKDTEVGVGRVVR